MCSLTSRSLHAGARDSYLCRQHGNLWVGWKEPIFPLGEGCCLLTGQVTVAAGAVHVGHTIPEGKAQPDLRLMQASILIRALDGGFKVCLLFLPLLP